MLARRGRSSRSRSRGIRMHRIRCLHPVRAAGTRGASGSMRFCTFRRKTPITFTIRVRMARSRTASGSRSARRGLMAILGSRRLLSGAWAGSRCSRPTAQSRFGNHGLSGGGVARMGHSGETVELVDVLLLSRQERHVAGNPTGHVGRWKNLATALQPGGLARDGADLCVNAGCLL